MCSNDRFAPALSLAHFFRLSFPILPRKMVARLGEGLPDLAEIGFPKGRIAETRKPRLRGFSFFERFRNDPYPSLFKGLIYNPPLFYRSGRYPVNWKKGRNPASIVPVGSHSASCRHRDRMRYQLASWPLGLTSAPFNRVKSGSKSHRLGPEALGLGNYSTVPTH